MAYLAREKVKNTISPGIGCTIFPAGSRWGNCPGKNCTPLEVKQFLLQQKAGGQEDDDE